MKRVLLVLLVGICQANASDVDYTSDDCGESLEKVYIAKRGCILNSDQQACRSLGALSSIYPLLGGAAGAGSAKLYNSFLEKTSSVPEIREAIAKTKAFSIAMDQAQAILDRAAPAQKAQQQLFGRTFNNFIQLREYLSSKSAGPDAFSEFEKLVVKIRNDQIDQAVLKTTDPLLKAALLEHKGENPSTGQLKTGFYKQKFGADWEAAVKVGWVSVGNVASKTAYDNLSPRGKLVHDLYFSDGVAGGVKALEVGQLALAKKAANVKTAALVGGTIAAVAPAVAAAVTSSLDKKHLAMCKDELGLSESELNFLKETPFLAEPKAVSASTSANFTCASIKLAAPDESLAQLKQLNHGKISVGVCKILKNELTQLDRYVGDIGFGSNASCEGLKDTNVGVFKKDEGYLFEHRDGALTYQAAWDEMEMYPRLRDIKVVDGAGRRDRNREQAFTKKYIFMHPSDVSEKSPGVVDIVSSCQGEGQGAVDCRLINSAVKAKIYFSLKTQLCPTSKIGPGGVVPKDIPGVE